MRLSLSVRVAESFSNKRVVDIPLPDLAGIAGRAGFGALCMRASVVGVRSAPESVESARALLQREGLAVSMVTGDFAVPENGDEGPGCLRNITPYLDLAQALGSNLIRVCIKTGADIPFARNSADEAAERNIRLAHQSHTLSLFETVEGSLNVLGQIGRSNFGLIYEPANLALCGEDYGPETLKTFQPYLFNVYLQNHAPHPDGDMPMSTWANGTVTSILRPLDAAGGIDFGRVFEGLHAISYSGYVTVHQAFGGRLTPDEAATRSARFLKSFIV
ncbi:MAG: sugar phosphate isomerase/epimerase [Gemmatimonadota bacterium]|nr:sugar phosphate isomerase/epimerase [Gemmatimonadota bacterium]